MSCIKIHHNNEKQGTNFKIAAETNDQKQALFCQESGVPVHPERGGTNLTLRLVSPRSWLSSMFCLVFHNLKTLVQHNVVLITLSKSSAVTFVTKHIIQRAVVDFTLEDSTCRNLLFNSCMFGLFGLARCKPPFLFSPFPPPRARLTS